MTDITINKTNLSRFSKRLQKALKEQFKQDVPLHIASLLFCNALGVNSEHELKTLLEKEKTIYEGTMTDEEFLKRIEKYDASILSSKELREKRVKELIQELEQYFKNNPTLFNHVSITDGYDFDDLAGIYIGSVSPKYKDIAGFTLYFERNPKGYLDKELKRLEHSGDDAKFLNHICDKYFSQDSDENKFFGSNLRKYLKLYHNRTYTIYKKKNDYKFEVNHLGMVTEKFILIPLEYKESELPSYRANQNWIELLPGFHQYDNFENALAHRKPQDLIVQCLVKSQTQLVSSFIVDLENKIIESTKKDLKITYENPEDIIRFKGFLDKHLFQRHELDNPYGINEKEYALWNQGYELEITKNNKLKV